MAIPFGSDINLNKNEIQNAIWHKLSGAPTSPVEGQFYYDTTSKRLKYYNGSSWITVGTTSIVDVDSLPEITDDNRNQILRYNNKLYYARPAYIYRKIQVGDNLSGATIKNNWPVTDENIWDITGSPWLDASVSTTQQDVPFIETSTNKTIYYYRGGATETHDYVSIDGVPGYFYEMSGGLVYSNGVEITLPSTFGTVTAINYKSGILYTQLFIKVISEYIWCEINKEVAVSTTEPTGDEVLWVNPEEDDIDISELLPIKIITGVIPGSSYDDNSKTQTVVIDYPSGFNASNTIVIASMLEPVSTNYTSTFSGRVDVLLYSSGEYANKMKVSFREAWGLDMYYKIVLMKM